jgi:hypothetical protein
MGDDGLPACFNHVGNMAGCFTDGVPLVVYLWVISILDQGVAADGNDR